MIEPFERQTGGGRRRLRKRLFFLMKVGLALAMLIVILAAVKVNDHLELPEGTPYAGKHVGSLSVAGEAGDGGVLIRFREKHLFLIPVPESEFFFEAVREEGKRGKLLSAHVQGPQGAYTFEAEALDRIQIREGLIRTLKQIDPWLWVLSNAVYFLAIWITALRWGYLLRAIDLPQTQWRAFRLTYIGIFFNNVVPGQTGGDLVRAYYIAKENRDRRTDSIISVIVDRVLGIMALALIGAVVIPFDFKTFGPAAVGIYGFVGAVGAVSLVYFSKRLRRFFRLDRILKKLPFQEVIRKIDRSIFLYRYRKKMLTVCFAVSLVIHGTIFLAIWILGIGMGIDLGLYYYMAFIPIIFIVSSLPITPSGWGVREALFVLFFGYAGVEPVLALALSLVFSANATIQSVLGGVFLLMEKDRVRPADLSMALAEPEEEVPAT